MLYLVGEALVVEKAIAEDTKSPLQRAGLIIGISLLMGSIYIFFTYIG